MSYFPVKFGTRRSAVAFTPSLKSSVLRSQVCSASSRSVAARTRSARSPRTVCDHREAEPAADGRALHGGDNRLLGAVQPVAFDIEVEDRLVLVELGRAVCVVARAAAEIGAGAEGLALRGEYDGAAVRVVVQGLAGGGDFLDQGHVEEVVRRPPDLDKRDVTGFLDADILERAHDRLSCSFHSCHAFAARGRAYLRCRRRAGQCRRGRAQRVKSRVELCLGSLAPRFRL